MAAPPPQPPPDLLDELVEDCLLRLPSDDPTNLVRAALVCKGWRRIVADRGFSCRFRKLHGKPLILGYLHIQASYRSFFTPTSSFRSGNGIGVWHAIDSRHGRVLLSRSPSVHGTLQTRRRSDLAVWNPVSGDLTDLPELPPPHHHDWSGISSKAAVLCASSSACDHNNCHRGQFLVVLMDAANGKVCVYVYSSQAGIWSHVTSAAQDSSIRLLPRTPVAFAGNALYFIVHKWRPNGILKYDVGAHDVSWLDLPPNFSKRNCRILFTTTEHGRLGIVLVENNSRLDLWSLTVVANGHSWGAPSRVIELKRVLPGFYFSISTITFVHELGAFFVRTTAGDYTVDLMSKWVKVHGNNRVNYFVP